MVEWHHLLNGHEFGQALGDGDGQRSLACCSPWGHKELDMTERLHSHFSLSCIGEGNGTPLQCSCLENPRDGGAWWATVHGAAQSWTRLRGFTKSGCSSMAVLFLLFFLSVMSDLLQPHGLQHARLPCPSLSCGVCSNSCPRSQRCHLILSPLSPPALSLSRHQGLFY